MMRMKKFYILFYFIFVSLYVAAQSLTISAPTRVEAGEQFRLSYTVNTKDASDFKVGKFPDDVEILMGPSTSRQSSFQMVNGHMSSSSSITYTYIILIEKEGTYSLPSASVLANGNKISSKTVSVKVVGSVPQAQRQQNSGGQQRSGRQQGQHQMRQAGSAISSSDLFIKVQANKTRVYEQEPILLTYKVYTLVDLTQMEGKMPDLKGFHTQEIQLPRQKTLHTENYNGKQYRCVTWSQYVMYPQMTGKLEIPSITFNGTVMQQNRYVDPFEAFFNGGSGYVEVQKAVKAPGLTVEVLPLPSKPANFSGAVGQLNISAQLDKSEVNANDPVTVRVVVSGTGNMKLMKQPVIKFPADFDTYDAKVTDKTKLSTRGVEGNMIYDFLAVPRHQGTFTIPSVEFTYFDTSSKSYKTLRTQSFELKVNKGKGGSGSAVTSYGSEDVKLLNKDIRYIKQGESSGTDTSDFLFGSTRYNLILGSLVLAFIVLFVIFRKRAIENANITKKKGKKANKVATKRLRVASKMMLQNRRNEFYDEVLRTLWGYVGDKLNMPTTSLSKDNIVEKLQEKAVDQQNIDTFVDAINECEYQRYAPGEDGGDMEKVFSKAMDAISNIDNQLGRRSKKKGSVVTVLLIILMSVSSQNVMAVTKAEGDSAYAKENYQEAIKIYESLLKEKQNGDILYNLGNAYYRIDNIPMAILNYERALLLSPGDQDIRFNLQMARSKTIDKIQPESELIFVTWYRSIINIASVDGWARVAITSLVIALLLALLYLFSDRIWLRKAGFFGGLMMLLLFLLSNIFAYHQKSRLENRTGAIVMSPSVTLKSTPSETGTDVFVLHEGTRVDIVDKGMKEWMEVRIADGKQGWMRVKDLEII